MQASICLALAESIASSTKKTLNKHLEIEEWGTEEKMPKDMPKELALIVLNEYKSHHPFSGP